MITEPQSRPSRVNLQLIRWSDAENEFLRSKYKTTPLEELEQALPGRTKNAIKQQAGILGLWGGKYLEKLPPWSEQEILVLKMYYPDNGLEICDALLADRSTDSVALKVRRLGLCRKGGPRQNRIPEQVWMFIFENVEHLGFVACAEKVGDTPDNLRDKCARKGFDCYAIDLAFNGGEFRTGSWSQDEIDYITEYFPSEGGVRVAQALGRPPKRVINHAKRKLGLKPQPANAPQVRLSVVEPVFVEYPRSFGS